MKFNKFFKAVRWMRSHKKLIIFAIIVILIAILASCMGNSDPNTALAVGALIGGIENGKHVVNGPLTTDLTNEGSPELLLNEIDQQIVKIRPMSTPIDQISRYAGSKHANSMVVDYYSVDTKPTQTKLVGDVAETEDVDGEDSPSITIQTLNDEIFDPTDTILVQGVSGYSSNGAEEDSQELMLYVMSRTNDGITVKAVNGPTVDGVPNCFPNIPSGVNLVRMGRAASELDVQSPQFEALPTKSRNLCQIFKGI